MSEKNVNFRLLNDLVDVYKLMFTAEVSFVSATLSVTLLIFQVEIVEYTVHSIRIQINVGT